MEDRALALDHVPMIWSGVRTQSLRRPRDKVGYDRINGDTRACDQYPGLTVNVTAATASEPLEDGMNMAEAKPTGGLCLEYEPDIEIPNAGDLVRGRAS